MEISLGSLQSNALSLLGLLGVQNPLSTQDPPFYSYKTSESGSGLNPPKSVYLRTDQAVYGGEEAACF